MEGAGDSLFVYRLGIYGIIAEHSMLIVKGTPP